MTDDDDDLTALARKMDGRFRAVDEHVDATRAQIDLLRLELSDKIASAQRDMGRLVLLCIWASTVQTSCLCLATIAVALLID